MKFNKYFDHTILKADATAEQVEKVCREAIEYDFASVCVNQYRTKMVADILRDTDVKVCTVVGFPLGAVSTAVKKYEAECAMNDGADEIDMVINIGVLKDGDYDYVLSDIKGVRETCTDITLKVIIETCLLNDEEKRQACVLAEKAGADFVKTSTGFSTGGAKTEDVALMRDTVGDRLGVKASGGIHTYDEAMSMINAGADRLGTSATLDILNKM
mgnify:CR=1 FL=1